MKSLQSHRIYAFAGFLLLFSSFHSFPQQLITFTDGTTLKAFITFQAKDTVRYYKAGYPETVYAESMDRILKIEILTPAMENNPALQSKMIPDDKEYWKHKKYISTGGIMMATGAVIGVAGFAGWSTKGDPDSPEEVAGAAVSGVGMFVGTGLFLVGGIILAVNVATLSAYKREHGLALKLNCTPKVSGVSLVYRF